MKWAFLHLCISILLYLFIVYEKSPQIFTFRFQPDFIQTYFVSQDIPHEVRGRVFLSDGQIHMAAGYLYAMGEDPSLVNFQHPPFIKYLYGLSILLTGSPYFVQLLCGVLLLIGTYILCWYIYKNLHVACIASLVLAIDPLFHSLSADLLLDLGQAALLVFYSIFFLFQQKSYWKQGILLGVLCASKFWAAPLFFVTLFTLYRIWKKDFIMKSFFLHIVVAVCVFCLVYVRSFIAHAGRFNILFFELKVLKYWLHHSISSVPAASLLLFTSGYFVTWWDNMWKRSEIWSFLWPAGLLTNSLTSGYLLYKKHKEIDALIGVIPLLYLLYLGVQAPFTRYFIIILPFLYIVLAKNLFMYAKYVFNRYSLTFPKP